MKKIVLILTMGLILTGCNNVSQMPENDGMQEAVQGGGEQTMVDVSEDIAEEVTEGVQAEGIYTYEDMTITIPASWEDKYIIRDGQDGFAIMQKASYEKEEGFGFLFGFYRSSEMVDESAGAKQIAYTDNYVYYTQEPTDVAFWYEDEAISTEYSEMMKDKELIISSLVIDAENVRYDAREYVLPMSHVKAIPEYILENMSADELWIARNEIFARHGREFTNAYLSNYFASCSWYTPTVAADAFDESVLSQTEKDNLDCIKAQEEEKAGENPYPQSCRFGEEYSYDLDGDGYEENFELNCHEDAENSIYHVTMVLDGDMVMELSTEDIYYFYPNTDEYYITDISTHFPGVEIAVMDYGMSDDLVTHFYTYEDGLHYIGTVGGFPFKKYMDLDGFAWSGNIRGTIRTDLIHTCFSYANWFYDYGEKELVPAQADMYVMVPTGSHELAKDIEVFAIRDVTAPTTVLKAQPIFFLETDGKEWLKIKGKDGTEGYLHVTDGKIDGVDMDPQQLISGIHFAG